MSALLHMAVLASVGAAASYDADAEAVFAVMASPPDATRKGHINTLITALKSAGVWTKLDHFVVMANTAAADGLLDWKNPATPWSAVNSPTFTSDRGYAGDGVSAHILGPTNYSALTQFQQNSAHLAVWSRTAGAIGSSYDVGVNSAATGVRMRLRNSANDLTVHLNQAAGTSITGTSLDGSGFFLATRSGSTTGAVYRNGSSIATISVTSNARPAAQPTVCRHDATYTTRQFALIAIGADVTAEEQAYYDAVAAYMVAVGAA